MTLQRALLLLALIMGLGLMVACGDDDSDTEDGGCPDVTYPEIPCDAGPDATCVDPCADAVCPDIASPVETWSCRATSFDKPTCTDFPKATWSEEDALAACEASTEMGGGQFDCWGENNCVVDRFVTTWRCLNATQDSAMEETAPYTAYAQTLPPGICATALAGTIEERPDDCCWTDDAYSQ